MANNTVLQLHYFLLLFFQQKTFVLVLVKYMALMILFHLMLPVALGTRGSCNPNRRGRDIPA